MLRKMLEVVLWELWGTWMCIFHMEDLDKVWGDRQGKMEGSEYEKARTLIEQYTPWLSGVMGLSDT